MKFFIAIIGLFSSLSFSAMQEETPDKPILYFYAGPWKTGTTSIDTFLKRNQAQLKKRGVFFPITFEWAGQQLHHHYDQGIFHLKDGFYKNFRQKTDKYGAKKVIWLNENMLGNSGREVTVEEMNTIHAMASRYFNVHLVLTPRDPYPWLWSLWGESRKDVKNLLSLEDTAKKMSPFSIRIAQMRVLLDSHFGRQALLMNMTRSKKTLYESFLTLLQVSPEGLEFNIKPANQGMSLSILNVYEDLRHQKLHPKHDQNLWSGRYALWKEMRPHNKSGFKYYSKEAHKAFLERFQDDFLRINEFMRKGQELSLDLMMPEGYTTEWDRALIEPEVRKAFLAFVEKSGGLARAKQLL